MPDITDVDDAAFESGGFGQYRWLLRPTLVVLAYASMFGGFVRFYDAQEESPVRLAGLEIPMLDWVSLFSLAVVAVVFGPALVRRRDQVLAFVRAFAQDRFAVLAMGGFVCVVALALLGPASLGRPEFQPDATFNPPVGFSVPEWRPSGCAGELSGGACHGSWTHPLGTDGSGHDVLLTAVHGLRTSLQVGFSAAVIAGTIGTVVGLVSGTVGGRVDAVLMRYVDLQAAMPAFFAYVLLVALLNVRGDLVLIVLVFGLLSWGGLARLVRSEVLQVREERYVQSARAAGSGPLYRIRHHVLPNVTTSVFVPLTNLVPLYVLYEAALSFLGLGESFPTQVSLGDEIAEGFDVTVAEWWVVWWMPVVPAAVLVVLICTLLVVGDRLGELLDPRERQTDGKR